LLGWVDCLNFRWRAALDDQLGNDAIAAADVDPSQVEAGTNQSRKISPASRLQGPIARS
jgi:hypothetical protein